MSGGLTLNFSNLPLVEAAVRATFAQSIDLRFSAINGIHEKLKPAFWQIDEPPAYETAPGTAEELTIKPGQITGVVFVDPNRGLRATVQRRMAVVRWVRQVIGQGPDYPRFAALRDALWKVVAAVRAAYEFDSLPAAVVNMSYVNFIQVADFSTVLTTYFSDLMRVRAADGADEFRKLEVSWRSDGADLRFQLEKVAVALRDNRVEGYLLTTVAGAHVPPPHADADAMLERVHDRLQAFFKDAISEHAKREWGLKELPGD